MYLGIVKIRMWKIYFKFLRWLWWWWYAKHRKAFLSGQSPYHEVPDGPVEDCLIIVAFLTQTDEVLSSFRNLDDKASRDCLDTHSKTK